ncbi:Putative Histidine kinase [Nitrospina watsonii]|uniref:histidine kinase n=1 Tax=Nitrospina watsonii TaxID=1323948 RepID=A0ABM9HG32_9BACT|nr:Putative Histidine kinase [Nitrospina watsonii]
MKKAEDNINVKFRVWEAITEFQSHISAGNDAAVGFRDLTRKILELTDSEYGFVGEIRRSPDGDPYVYILAYESISNDPVIRQFFSEFGRSGLEFFNIDTLFGSVMTTGQVVVANEPQTDPRRGGLPKGHPPLDSFIGLPFSQSGDVVGMLCLANAKDGYSQDLMDVLQPLLDICGQVVLGMRSLRDRALAESRLKQQTRYIQLLKDLTRIADEASSFEDCFQSFLKQICETLDGALGLVHQVEDSGTCLVPTSIHYQNVPDLTSPAMSKTMESVFVKGEGLAGRVWELSQPVWQENVWRDKAFLKRLEITGSGAGHSGFAFPVPMNNSVAWVVQIFTSDMRESDPELLNILASAGSHLGLALERKRLTINQAILSAIMRSTEDAIIGLDLDGKINSWNLGAQHIFGYVEAEQIGSNVVALLGADQTDEAAQILESIRNGEAVKFELKSLTKNNDDLDLTMALTPVFDPGGKRIGASIIAWDTTEGKMKDQELLKSRIQAQSASRAKREFLAHMSHEIHTPLNSVLGFAQILERDPKLTSQHKEYIARIVDGGNQLMRLVDDILEMSKIDVGDFELHSQAFDLCGMIDRIASSIRNRCLFKGLDFFAESFDEKPLWVLGDEIKLQMALINILGNAVKFTDSGAVLLRVEQKSNERFQFEIIDTGRGIGPEQLDKIFDAFEKLGEVGLSRGMGLGLSISKKHIEAMGGSVAVQSVEGKGTHFTIEVTLKRFGDLLLKTEQGWYFNKPLAWKEMQAVLVGNLDQKSFEELTRSAHALGVDVEQVADVGPSCTLENPEADLIFIGLDDLEERGETLVRNLRRIEAFAEVPIVVLASPRSKDAADRCQEAGADLIVIKPIKRMPVLKAVEKRFGMRLDFLKNLAEAKTVSENREIDLRQIILPQTTLEAMKAAASSYNFTSFEKQLDVLKEEGEEKKLALFFKDMMRSYDMKQINQVLEFLDKMQGHRGT